ncbi:MAG: lysylphosphatidylglycerol synthase domain-containing protein [Solirubrobacteraceae bacterium]
MGLPRLRQPYPRTTSGYSGRSPREKRPEASLAGMSTTAVQGASAHHAHCALTAARGHLKSSALRLLGYAVLAILVLKLVPGLKQALQSVTHVSWLWLLAAGAIETVSELGFVVAWRAIIDPEGGLTRGDRGSHVPLRIAWTQLGGGLLIPAGSLGGVGVGGWILHRLGMPTQQIAERQFNLSFLNTATDAATLIVVGLALAAGLLNGSSNLALTLLPALVAAAGVLAVLLIARRLGARAATDSKHPKLRASLSTLAEAVNDTKRMMFRRSGARATLGAAAYLWFDVLVLWSAFLAVHADPVPTLGVVVMAYIIGALGGSLPLPAGAGAVGGIAGMLILYGVDHNPAVAAVVVYQAVGLLVPVTGAAIAYLLLRRQLPQLEGSVADTSSPPSD